MMRGLHVYAGATLLSSGQLALVLDVNGIAELAQVKPIEQAQEVAELRVETPMLAAQQQLLVYEDMQGQRSALALTDVKRIDAVRSGAIERMGGRWLIEDKGRVLPVAGIDHLDHLPADELMTLILLREPAQALLVQRVLDIAAEDLMPAFSERGVTVSRVNAQLTMMPARVNALPEAA
jgi:two-component system chemotaxis sensor kinase CheA